MPADPLDPLQAQSFVVAQVPHIESMSPSSNVLVGEAPTETIASPTIQAPEDEEVIDAPRNPRSPTLMDVPTAPASPTPTEVGVDETGLVMGSQRTPIRHSGKAPAGQLVANQTSTLQTLARAENVTKHCQNVAAMLPPPPPPPAKAVLPEPKAKSVLPEPKAKSVPKKAPAVIGSLSSSSVTPANRLGIATPAGRSSSPGPGKGKGKGQDRTNPY